jgi:hypothetical protein
MSSGLSTTLCGAGEFRAGTRRQLTRTAGLEADPQHPALPLGVCAGQLDEVIGLAHSAFRRGDDVTSGDGGPHTAGVALEDAHPELMLQLAQGIGQRGPADVQDLGGATEIARPARWRSRSAARHLPDPNRQRRQRGGLHHGDRDVLNVAHADALHAAGAGLLGDEDRRRLPGRRDSDHLVGGRGSAGDPCRGEAGPGGRHASGLINTSQQIGGALGIAALSTIGTSRTEDSLATATILPEALVDGFSSAFLVGAIFAVLGLVASLTLIRRDELEPQTLPARENEPALDAA